MKTFETEKSKIPEGATHYANESDVDYFLWCKIDREGKVWGLVEDEGLISTVQQIKKPRTKTEFVQEESFKDVLKCSIDGEVFYSKDGNGQFKFDASRLLFVNHNGADVDISHLTEHCFYRKVETEIDERQEFIDEAVELLNQNSHDNEANHYKEWFGAMFDSGKFKLVG